MLTSPTWNAGGAMTSGARLGDVLDDGLAALLGKTRDVGDAFGGVATPTGDVLVSGDSAAGDVDASVEGLGRLEMGARPHADRMSTVPTSTARPIRGPRPTTPKPFPGESVWLTRADALEFAQNLRSGKEGLGGAGAPGGCGCACGRVLGCRIGNRRCLHPDTTTPNVDSHSHIWSPHRKVRRAKHLRDPRPLSRGGATAHPYVQVLLVQGQHQQSSALDEDHQ